MLRGAGERRGPSSDKSNNYELYSSIFEPWPRHSTMSRQKEDGATSSRLEEIQRKKKRIRYNWGLLEVGSWRREEDCAVHIVEEPGTREKPSTNQKGAVFLHPFRFSTCRGSHRERRLDGGDVRKREAPKRFHLKCSILEKFWGGKAFKKNPTRKILEPVLVWVSLFGTLSESLDYGGF